MALLRLPAVPRKARLNKDCLSKVVQVLHPALEAKRKGVNRSQKRFHTVNRLNIVKAYHKLLLQNLT